MSQTRVGHVLHDRPASSRWPAGSVRALLDTDRVTEATRRALRERLGASGPAATGCLDAYSLATLRAACARLIPQLERDEPERIDVAGAINAALASGSGDGWRYDALPPDADAHRLGLAGLDETATALFGALFTALNARGQDAVLAEVQAGDPPGATWDEFPSRRYFEDLLALAVETYYAHPLAQEEIGFVGMADAQGWAAIGLDEREEHEPKEVGRSGPASAIDAAT